MHLGKTSISESIHFRVSFNLLHLVSYTLIDYCTNCTIALVVIAYYACNISYCTLYSFSKSLLSSERGNLEQEYLKKYYEFSISFLFFPLYIYSFERWNNILHTLRLVTRLMKFQIKLHLPRSSNIAIVSLWQYEYEIKGG